jgi:hypothetical protein
MFLMSLNTYCIKTLKIVRFNDICIMCYIIGILGEEYAQAGNMTSL